MFILPVGPDRADGITQLPEQPVGSGGKPGTVGTPDPDGGRDVTSQGGAGDEVTQEEEPDSPEIERAEQATFQHRLTMLYKDAITFLGGMGRGTIVADSGILFGIVTTWRILSAKVKAMRGGRGELSYTAESISFDSPPDDFDVQPVELGLDLLRHPRYAWALAPVVGDNTPKYAVGSIMVAPTNIKSAIIRMIQTYRDAPVFPSANQINGLFQTNIMSAVKSGWLDIHYDNPTFDPLNKPLSPDDKNNRWDAVSTPPGNYPYFVVGIKVNLSDPTDPVYIALNAAKEIISKLWRQEDTPYYPGWEVTLVQYFFLPVYLDGGGYIQDPVSVIPDYFYDPTHSNPDPNAPTPGPTIFDQLTKANPQAFATNRQYGGPLNISWLRKADREDYQRTWFKVTMTWIGSANGTWDTDLYKQGHPDGSGDGPQNANDFSNLI